MPKLNKNSKQIKKNVVKNFLKKNWGIITSLVLILVLIIIITVFNIKSNKKSFELFEGSDNKPSIVLFYAPWCGHCKNIMPKWNSLQQSGIIHKTLGDIKIVKIDCDNNKELAKKHNIDGFPTIKFYPSGLDTLHNVVPYNGDRDENSIKRFIHSI